MLKRLLLVILLASSVSYSQIPSVNAGIYRYTDTHGKTLPTLLNGMTWRDGDTMYIRLNGVTIKELMSGAGDGQVKVWDSTLNLWKFGNAGAGGTMRFNEILNPNGATALDFGGNLAIFGATNQTIPGMAIFSFIDASTGQAGTHMRINTNAGSLRRPVEIFAQGTTNGVYMTTLGKLTYSGTGVIDANLWKGSATFDKASQHPQTAYKDASNVFSAGQAVVVSVLGGNAFTGSNSAIGSLSHGVTGDANGGTGVWGQSILSYGVHGVSQYGAGGDFGSINGPMATFFFGPLYATRLTFNWDAIVPESNMDLGTWDKPFDSLYVNNFVDLATQSGTAIFGANDTAFIYSIPGVDSNWVVQANFIDRPLMVASLGAKAYNDGHIEITSSSSPMESLRVSWIARRKTQN